MPVVFSDSGRITFVPGRHITNNQMRLFIKFRQTNIPGGLGSEASISTATHVRFMTIGHPVLGGFKG